MIFPRYIKRGDCIGITAVSDGVSDELDKKRFYNGKNKLLEKGYKVKFTDNVFMVSEKGKSSPAYIRGKEFNSLLDDKDVSMIISAKGGNFLNEMLEYVDFEKILANPKWFQGYSDNTGLIHTLTTKYDIASVYAGNFGDFGMEVWHKSIENNIKILEGENVIQKTFDKYQDGFCDRITGLEGYNEDNEVRLKLDSYTSKKTNNVSFTGRLIGGCLDVLVFLQGTKYDNTFEFIEKYKNDGIIWYLESFDISAENLMMFLWKLSEIGWFKYTKGFLFGRPLFYKDYTNTPYEEAVMYGIGKYDVPVIFDCNFGHKPPRHTIINGALARINYSESKGSIEYL